MKTVTGLVLVIAMTAGGALVPTRVSGQAPQHLQHVEQALAQKQAAAEAHRTQMEAIKDPGALNVEMRKHFQMTEEILALMLERQKLTSAKTPAPAPAPSQEMTQGGMQGGKMGGMHGGMQGGMPGGGAQGGMTLPPQGQAMGGSMMQKEQEMMQKEMGGTQGGTAQGGTPGMAGMGAASPSTAPGTTRAPMSDMDQMMRRIGEHSTYMETVKDPATLQQEMLRHQKMLDQMVQLMQK
jgi:hypothetical protein